MPETSSVRTRSFLTAELRPLLVAIAGDNRVLTRPIELIAYAADASFYRLIPKAVVLDARTSARSRHSSASAGSSASH